jgi:peptidoglycan DL-endopeptidase CwlO
MGSREKMAVTVAVELYQAGEIEAVEGLLTAESFAELETRLSYLNSSERAQTRIFEALAADRDELNAVLEELSEKQEKVAAAEQELGDLTAEINEKLESQKDEIEALTAAIERAEARRRAREAAARAAAERAAQRAARRAAQQAARPPAQPSQPAAPSPDSPGPAPNPSGGAATAVSVALDQVGDPYQWGGAGPDSFDCSGLTMFAWAAAGVSLPHNSSMQYAATVHVAQSDWRPGDLLFYGSPIHHVGMYVGNGQMVEAPYTGAQVRVVSAFRSDYVGAGRPGV